MIKEDWLYVHGGYGSSKETVNQFTAYSTMERINLVNFKCEKIHYQQVVANVERRWHTSFIYNNKFYIHGGWNDGGPVSDLTALDLDTLSWEVVPTTNAPSERRWHSLTPLSGSSPLYLLFGGYDGDFQKTHSDAHVLNLETMNWTSPSFRGDLPGAHINHTMVRISEKMLLLLGGRDVHKNNYKVNHVLTTDNLTWREVKNSGDLHPINRSGHTAVRLGEHGLVVLGGNNPKYIEPFYYMDTRMLLF
uniref:Galactose oxidase n=1 Tax=Arcella intermedia TaxID=1963864 RepID=A0A6B2LET9_9EUKA